MWVGGGSAPPITPRPLKSPLLLFGYINLAAIGHCCLVAEWALVIGRPSTGA